VRKRTGYLFALAVAVTNPYLDLHIHPFMDDGMGTLFHGKFEGPLRAKDWTAGFDSQVNIETLEASRLGLIVLSLYAHPVVSNGRKESLRRQIARAEEFVKAHPDWVIARSAEEASAARTQGKRIIILGLEGASGVLESEADLHEFIDEKGIRIVTLLHLTDDHLGGAAFFRAMRGFLFEPISWFVQLLAPRRDENGVKLNKNGLSKDGAALARELIKRKVWIDLAHASDAAMKDLIPILKEAHQPLLITHTILRRYNAEERATADWEISEVASSGGIIGLMPSEEALTGTPASCGDGIHELATQFKEVATRLGAASTSIGSDFNGGINHLKPPVCATGTSFDAHGLWNVSQSGDMWEALKHLNVPWPKEGDAEFITAFVKAWRSVQ
jgi:microsomal dipeptidase-like Zn-dependent dipeptidase